MEANNPKRFSAANPFISWYLVDMGRSTTQTVEGVQICHHFSRIVNDVFNAFIDKHRDQMPDENYSRISVFTVLGKGLKNDWEGGLPNLNKNPIVFSIMDSRKTTDEDGLTKETRVTTPVFLLPIPQGKSHLGWAMEVLYGKCMKTDIFPHRLTIMSGTLVFDDSNYDDYALAQECAGKFKEQGTEICFAHMSSKKGNPVWFPNDENELTDDTSRYAFQMASSISEDDCVLANKHFGYDLLEGAKWVSTFSNPVAIKDFIQLGFLPDEA